MPVSTSLSASSLNDQAGARTGLASMTSGALVILTLLFLAPLFSDLPTPVLAALIIEAVVMGMMDVPELRRLARVQKFDFWIAVTAIVSTLAFGVLAGVVFGVGLSLLWLVSVTTRPALPLLGRATGTTVFRELAEFPEDEQFPGVAVIRLEGGLFFATSDALDERVRQVIRQSPEVTCLVLDCSAMNFVDSQGVAELTEVLAIADEEQVTLRLARLKPVVTATLSRDGILESITEARIHPSVDQAVQAQLEAPPAPPKPPSE
jgi:sulfate permease, SulP family